jgi:drug/metabolite transporter (DMT)-like permease
MARAGVKWASRGTDLGAASYWWLFTLVASGAQTLRNAMQRELIGALGAVGATQVRFLFGLPFAILFLIAVALATGEPFPPLSAPVLGWASIGAVAQIAATALMLAAMRTRSFVVVVAATKTEAAQVAVFALVFLGERPTPVLIAAIVLATAGVWLMSGRGAAEAAKGSWSSIAMGLVSASFFAIAAVGFRAAVLNVATPSFVMAASELLVIGLTIQTTLLFAYLALFDRPRITSILAEWRPSLFAGFMGALSSQFWFIAFALTDAARVRTLALVEVLFAQAVSMRLFREMPSAREIAGMTMIVVAAAVLVSGMA